jgi:two-component system sensor histidine kinase/response regulator
MATLAQNSRNQVYRGRFGSASLPCVIEPKVELRLQLSSRAVSFPDFGESAVSGFSGKIDRIMAILKTPRTFETKQSWALGIVALCCVGIIIGAFQLVGAMLTANWWVNHTLQVMRESEESLLCLVDCETAYRGFLVTADEVYLEPLISCKQHVFSHIEKLQELTADNPSQRVRMPEIEKLARDKVEFCERAVALRRRSPELRARDVVNLAPGKKMMDEFRAKIAELLYEEDQLYSDRTRAAVQSQRDIYLAIALMSLIICVAIGWIFWSTRQYAAEQDRARELIAQARDAAVSANELKSQFVANVSHEIRTPLSGVLGMSELLTRTDLDNDKKEMANHIYKSAQNLLGIVNDLLDFSKLEAGRITLQKSEYPLETLVQEVLQSVSITAESKNIALKSEIDPTIGHQTFVCDPDRIRQVLLNVVHNAVKFTHAGTVIVAVSQESKNNKQVTVCFSVTDTGIGFSGEESSRLFQPFVQVDGTTSRRFGGTGLGLSICKKIVELMSGQIGCSSQGEGKGSIFWFKVPVELSTAQAVGKDNVTQS